jgi:N-acetylneuraminic acid mutarotase
MRQIRSHLSPRSPSSHWAVLIAYLSFSVLLASCGGDGSAAPSPPRLLSITITPSNPIIAKGLTQQLKATGTFSNGSTTDLTSSASWASGTPATATVNATSGLATSAAVGSTVISATSGSVSGNTTLTITPATLESISIAPPPPYAGIGISQQLTATGTYSDASTANITNTATWMSGTPSVATVVSATGLATGVSLGVTTISAAVGSVSATASLTVVADVWTSTDSLATARYGHTATLLPNGKVLVAGGVIVNAPLYAMSAELYDPVTGTWSATGTLATARAYHTATLLQSGKVLVTGGLNNGSSIASAELYDPVTGTWSPTASLSTALSGHTATILTNGAVLVAGGNGAAGGLVGAELYDPVAGTWSTTGNLSTGRYDHTATLLPNGTVLAAGGYSNGVGAIASAELYDPVAGTWSATGSLSVARSGHTATLLNNGVVLVAAGSANVSDNGPNASAELYDPAVGAWSTTGSLSTARSDHTATLLPNGMVLVAGGIGTSVAGGNVGSSLSSAELYDPLAAAWFTTGDLSTARTNHTATLLQNGVVLVTGGSNNTTLEPLASSELYW